MCVAVGPAIENKTGHEGIGVIIAGISQILPGLVVFFLPGPAGAGPLSTTLALLEAVGGESKVEAELAGVSFLHPVDLAGEITVETVDATELAPDAWQMRWLARPAMTRLHLTGFPSESTFNEPRIDLLPVAAASALHLRAEQQVAHLQMLLAAQPETLSPAADLPFLPLRNAAQILHARERFLRFENGSGLCYLIVFAQENVPIAGELLLYTFQGLTADGRFYVSASFPVQSDALPESIAVAQERD